MTLSITSEEEEMEIQWIPGGVHEAYIVLQPLWGLNSRSDLCEDKRAAHVTCPSYSLRPGGRHDEKSGKVKISKVKIPKVESPKVKSQEGGGV